MVCPHNYRLAGTRPKPDRHPVPQLVAFDMDGVLIDVGSSWKMVHDHFGTHNRDAMADYLAGRIDDHAFIAHDVARWNAAQPDGRVHIDRIDEILRVPTLMQGAKTLVDRLHEQGVTTSIVSGGLAPMADKVGQALGIDLVYANALAHDDDGYLTGHGILNTPLNDKASPLRTILDDTGIRPERAIAIGNSCPDVSMFEHVGYGIAFNPDDDCVRHGADCVVEGRDLARVQEHLFPGAA